MKPDPKVTCRAGFGHPEVRAFLTEELRRSTTGNAVRRLSGLDEVLRSLPLRESSGLVAWYRRHGITKG